ncbi:MAG: flagellar biosynthesis repressor FlbT [Alkalilacustris sp.]
MTGLVLKLGPKERVLINGAVIENGDRRARLAIVTPNAHILRLRDAIHPEEVTTPVRRVCYIVQLVLSGDVTPADAQRQLLRGIEQLSQVLTDPDSRAQLTLATESVIAGAHYQALKALRALLPREERLLAGAPVASDAEVLPAVAVGRS